MALWRRYEQHLRDLGLYPSAGSEQIYKSLLGASRSPVENEEEATKFVATNYTNRHLGDGRTDSDQRAVGRNVVTARQPYQVSTKRAGANREG
jgi:hypothetical protein